MNHLTGDGDYIDTLERALYNGVLSGASADGTHYFYGNPLASDGDVHRHEWFGVACCPPNLARLISELGHYLYAQGDDEAVINLFAASTARFRLDGQSVTVEQRTDYPTTGRVRITVTPDQGGTTFTLAIRIPAWAAGTATLDGQPVGDELVDGYLRVRRAWQQNETLELDLNLAPRRTWANPLVSSTSGAVALERGPLVYCVEGVDHSARVSSLVLPRHATLHEEVDEETGQVNLHADALAETGDLGPLYRPTPPSTSPIKLTAVPYFTWSNRGESDMAVWVREAVLPPSPDGA
jgi:DUF1680 family protein